MRKSAGFTLIELVIVIVILGILGAVAAPKLFNLQGDAYGANLNAMKNNISSAMVMANAKAQLKGRGFGAAAGSAGEVTEYTNTKFKLGFPIADTLTNGDITNPSDGILGTLDEFDTSRYTLTSADGVLTINPKTIAGTTCQIIYNEATGTEPATVKVDTTGC